MSGYTPPFQMTDEITCLVIEIGELLGAVSVHAGMSPGPKLRRENRIRSIYSSLAIENNTLSLDQVTDIIDGKRVLGPPQDIREVKNAYEAYDRLSVLNPYSPQDLLLAHRLMMQGLIPDAGCCRSGNVGVFNAGQLIHAGTPAAYVPEVMAQLFDWLAGSATHPLIKGSVFHYEFEFIHPFSDGNGRTGRLWHSLILQRWKPVFAWLPIESMIHERQEEYYLALNASDGSGESTGFVAFMLTLIRDVLREIAEADASDVGVNVGRNVGRNVGVNVGRNEESVLAVLQATPSATAKSIAQVSHLSARQVERIISKLKSEGRLIRHGSSKNGVWEVLPRP